MALISFHLSLHLFWVWVQYRKLTLRMVVLRVFKATLTGTAGIIFLGFMMHFRSVSRLLVVIFSRYAFLGPTVFKVTLYR